MYEQKEKTYQRPVNRKRKVSTENRLATVDKLRCKNFFPGIEFSEEAIKNASFVDKKCPFTGDVSIRGKVVRAEVKSAKMQRTVVCRKNYLHFVKKYKRYEKRHTNIHAHVSPAFHVQEGDIVLIGECRPLAKNVHFNVIKILRKGNGKFTNKAY